MGEICPIGLSFVFARKGPMCQITSSRAQEAIKTHGMRNEFALRSRTGVRASFLALTCAWGTEGISSRQTETTAELIG